MVNGREGELGILSWSDGSGRMSERLGVLQRAEYLYFGIDCNRRLCLLLQMGRMIGHIFATF